MDILALIPARGGSKVIPQKNIRSLAGRPLLWYTIAAARQSQYPLRLVTSTEDPEIAAVAAALGAEAPFLRPAELARDETPMVAVLQHALLYLAEHDRYTPDLVLLLQPTSPLREARHVDEAIELMLNRRVDSVVSVCEAEHSPNWMVTVDIEGRVHPFLGEGDQYMRRQDLPRVYRLNGAIYLTRPELILRDGTILGTTTHAYIMAAEASVDIDTELDWLLAEALIRRTTRPAMAESD